MSLLLPVHGRSAPVTANRACGNEVNSCCPMASFRFISGNNEQAGKQHPVIFQFYYLVSELVFY